MIKNSKENMIISVLFEERPIIHISDLFDNLDGFSLSENCVAIKYQLTRLCIYVFLNFDYPN